MEEEITRDLFAYLAQLAAFELTEEEAEYLRRELNKQLTAIHELEAVPLDPETPITSHGVPYTPQISTPPREDRWQPFERPQRLVEQAPESEEGYIIVPDIPHEEL